MITRLELQHYRRLSDHHRRSPEARAFRRRLEAEMAKLPYIERRLLFLRYCCRLSWVAVSMRLHYSEAHIYRINKRLLKKLEEAE